MTDPDAPPDDAAGDGAGGAPDGDAPAPGPPPLVDPTDGVPTRRLVWSLVAYLLLAFGLAWAIALAVYLHYGPHAYAAAPATYGDHDVLTLSIFGAMLCPAAAAFIVRGLVVRAPILDLGLTWGLVRGWLLGLAVPLALVLAAFALGCLAGPAHYDWHLTALRESLSGKGPTASRLAHASLPAQHAITFIQAAIAGPFIALPFTLGEELGWRGHMTPILMRLFGRPAGLVVAGILWGLWHLPLILMGHDYPHHPVLGAVVFVGFCVLLSPLLQWLFEMSGSALAPALGHGVVNQATSYLASNTVGYAALTVGTFGWPGYACFAVAAAFCFRRFARGRGERRRAMGSLARLAA